MRYITTLNCRQDPWQGHVQAALYQQEALYLLALHHQLLPAASVGGVCHPVLDISPMRGLAADTTLRPLNS